jgi:hypothetical protein
MAALALCSLDAETGGADLEYENSAANPHIDLNRRLHQEWRILLALSYCCMKYVHDIPSIGTRCVPLRALEARPVVRTQDLDDSTFFALNQLGRMSSD